MRKRDIFIFLSIVLSLYGLINLYLFSHAASVLEGHRHYPWFVGAYLAMSLAWIVGRFLERVRITIVSSFLIWFGSFWLAAILYFLMIAMSVDLLRLANAIVPFIPQIFFTSESRQSILLISIVTVGLVVVGGAINAATQRIKSLDLKVAKNAHTLKSLTVVAASDIHLGTIICKSRLERIVKKINALNADIVLLPGDVVDEDIGPVIKQNLGETLRSIKSKYGVYAITGNHEYIGGVEPSTRYLGEHGVRELRDEAVKIADSFYVVGREDVSYNRGTERKRKSLQELLSGIDKSLPIILMDHQPFRLNDAEENGVDLQLSGHTHHGQLWPLSYITKKIFEVSWGYKKMGNTHVYVSCGVGSWGPPVRIGNSPEILNITLTFAYRDFPIGN
jgi:uncharacterized protein